MKRIENEILAELEVLSGFNNDIDPQPIRPWPKEDHPDFKFLQFREYIFHRLDESGFGLDDICKIIEVKSIVFVDWYCDYLEIDLRTLCQLEGFLNEKLIYVPKNEKVSAV